MTKPLGVMPFAAQAERSETGNLYSEKVSLLLASNGTETGDEKSAASNRPPSWMTVPKVGESQDSLGPSGDRTPPTSPPRNKYNVL